MREVWRVRLDDTRPLGLEHAAQHETAARAQKVSEERHERDERRREIEAEAEAYGSQSAVDTFRIAARIARKAVTR